ncbi:MAG: hypothetical protein FRX49_06521 [Trebouxia sp. A1-2]|nr:MAG: hypothetical protein FRX49_06521 [Trebouxia sp. A1-2]
MLQSCIKTSQALAWLHMPSQSRTALYCNLFKQITAEQDPRLAVSADALIGRLKVLSAAALLSLGLHWAVTWQQQYVHERNHEEKSNQTEATTAFIVSVRGSCVWAVHT